MRIRKVIGQITQLIYDMMDHTESYQIPELMLLLEFEKALATVDRHFIKKNVLHVFIISVQGFKRG